MIVDAVPEVVAALIGAVVGGAVVFALHRARPILTVESMQLAAEASTRVPIKTNRDLVRLATDFHSANPLTALPLTILEAEYVERLRSLKNFLEDQLAFALPDAERSATEFRALAANEDYTRLERSWAAVSIDIFEILSGAAIRGSLQLDIPMPPATEPLAARDFDDQRRLYFSDQGAVVLTVPHPQNVAFPFGGFPGPHHENLARLGVALATSLAERRRDDLMRVFDELGRQVRERIATTRELDSATGAELASLRRLMVNVIVSNAGRSAVSVAGKAELFIRLQGYRATSGTESSDVQLRLTLVKEGGGPASTASTPVLVTGGESHRIFAVSENRAQDFPRSDALLQAFAGAEVKCYLGVRVFGRRARRETYSNEVLFRDVDQSEEIKPRKR